VLARKNSLKLEMLSFNRFSVATRAEYFAVLRNEDDIHRRAGFIMKEVEEITKILPNVENEVEKMLAMKMKIEKIVAQIQNVDE
jgi:hypothetical protein